jgi:hypothetical protein
MKLFRECAKDMGATYWGLLVGLCLLSHYYVNIRGLCRKVSNGLVNHVGR